MSRGRTILVLLILAAGLGGFFYYDTYSLAPRREKAESAKGRIWTVEPKDVERVTVARKGETIRLQRTADGSWEMLEPIKTRGDRGAVDDMVTGLATARMDREIDANPAKPADFGLDPPEAEVKLEVKGRAEPLVLRVGSKNPTGVWVYAREGGKPAVITLSESIARDATRPLADFRDRTVIAFDRRNVSGIDLDVNGDQIGVVADEPGKWRIVKPRPLRADTDLISEFLDKLEGAKAVEFVDDAPKSLQPYGLDKPSKVTVWVGKDKDRAARTLLVGRPVPEKKGVYVKREGEPGVILTAEAVWTVFPKTVGAIRDKTVVSYASDKLAKIEITHGRETLGLEKEGTGWKITAPEALRADSGAVTQILWKIRDLQALGFLSEGAAEVPRFLSKPEVIVRLWETGAKEPKTLLLQSSNERRGGQPAALAAVQGEGPVVLVAGKALTELTPSVAQLRDRTVFPTFDLGDVKRARVSGGDKPLIVEKSGETDWKQVEPARGATKDGRVANVLLALKSLKWKEIASKGGDDAKFGVDRPELEVSVFKADGTEVGTLLVGKTDGAVTYVKVKAEPGIFAVSSKDLEDLRKARTDIPV
ncbi:MAG TPA: DUF4340 domain-containing protein [Methylomirabilota bacterium]|jgi:Domain of unknown function (DUF4340)|nr:DUF4340 domain-containing protein [Methylomirabilota bacterium]